MYDLFLCKVYLRRGPGGAARARQPATQTVWACEPRAASAPRLAPATRVLRPSDCIADAPPFAGASTTNILFNTHSHLIHILI